jgi:phosphate acetyltransferase
VLVVEGLHTDSSHSFTSQLNVDIARSLKAEVIVVADASLPNAVADLRLTSASSRTKAARSPASSSTRRRKASTSKRAKRRLGKTPLWGVVHEQPDPARAAHARRRPAPERRGRLAGEMATRRVMRP